MSRTSHDGRDDEADPDERTALLQHSNRTRQNPARRDGSYSSATGHGERRGNDKRVPLPGPEDPIPPINTAASKGNGSLDLVSPTQISEDETEAAAAIAAGAAADVEANNSYAADAGQQHTFLIDTHPAQFRAAFGGIMLAYFIANFDVTIMASSHPVITSYFGASNSASWLTTAFLLTSTACQPIAGRLSDTLGRKPLYVGAMAVFAAATAWCALADSMATFIAARAVCGLGAGSMMALGSISINDIVPIERRGPYQSFINVIYGLAASSGAAFGGLLADTLGWRWEFGIQVFPLVGCIIIATFSIPSDLGLQRDRANESLWQAMRAFDFLGSGLLTLSTTSLILGLNLGGNILPWSHPFIIAMLIVFGLSFSAFLYAESRATRPITPLVLISSMPRANLIYANFLSSFMLNAILFNVPLFFRAVLLTTATTSGLYLLVPTIVASLTGTSTGFLITWTRRLKWPVVIGTLGYVAGTALLSQMTRGWPTWAYLLCLVPAAIGQGFQFPGTQLAMLNASLQKEQAVVSSTVSLWRALGNVLGVACSSLVFQNALLGYLWRFVTADGPDGSDGEEWKRDLIERVRSNVEVVAELPDGLHKDQVIMSYEAACRVTFSVCVGIAVISVLLLAPIRLPRLGDQKR